MYRQCFVAGTKVKTEDGDKNIEEIKAGDKVWSYNPATGETGLKTVKQTFENETETLVHVTVSNENDKETIDTTVRHPFYVVGFGFRYASELRVGDKVLSVSGDIYEVTAVEIEDLDEPVKIYNFEVEDWHTYFVSESGILVHNDCDTIGGKTSEDTKQQDTSTSSANTSEGGSGATFEGTIYRSVNKQYNPLEMSQYTINSNHRYTEKGVPGLYFSSGEKIVKAELGNYDVTDFSNRIMYSYDVKLTNMLDVSNPSIRENLGVSLDSIVGESYDVTHAIGRYAYSNGYNGIIAPSARADGGVNIILFDTKEVK